MLFEVAPMLERCGVKAIAIHCRTSKQLYSGKADYEAIRGLKELIHVPLIVSGDIFSLDDAIKAQSITKADLIMVARGGVGNPNLVRQINEYFENGKRIENSSIDEQIEYAKEFAELHFKYRDEFIAVRELRGILPHFLFGFPGYKKIRLAISQAKSKEEIFEALERAKAIN